jgi:hypothetical protein
MRVNTSIFYRSEMNFPRKMIKGKKKAALRQLFCSPFLQFMTFLKITRELLTLPSTLLSKVQVDSPLITSPSFQKFHSGNLLSYLRIRSCM